MCQTDLDARDQANERRREKRARARATAMMRERVANLRASESLAEMDYEATDFPPVMYMMGADAPRAGD